MLFSAGIQRGGGKGSSMKSDSKVPATIDEYIQSYPKDIQAILTKVRATIRKAAPGAGETIKYRLATFTLNSNLVHFGAFKNHIGFYPTPSGTAPFKKELAPYVFAKGSIQFPLDKPIPYGLITKIVKFRVEEIRAKAEGKDRKKK
jgi:uncharacterized protein YdhG (YjbR/CyaY superfamily)